MSLVPPPHHPARRGDELVKKMCSLDTIKPTVDLEEPSLLARVFSLFHGNSADANISPEQRTSPAG